MNGALRLMCVFAHPDDESLGMAGTLARYAAEGVETYLVTATRGERGWTGREEDDPGLEAMGRTREAELRAAVAVLGIRDLAFLDYVDGDLAEAEPQQAISRVVRHIRRVRPQVIVTFGPDGIYGHPDHIAISQFTAAAVLLAADPSYVDPGAQEPYRVSKLYYMVDSQTLVDVVTEALGEELSMPVDGEERHHVGWKEWAVTTRIDASAHWRTAWQAVLCHQSQLPSLGPAVDLPDQVHRQLMAQGTFYRAMSLVNGGRHIEEDLFEGLREKEPVEADLPSPSHVLQGADAMG